MTTLNIKEHINFAMSQTGKLSVLLAPLRQYGITDLHYFRLYENGEYLSLVTNNDFMADYIERETQLSPFFTQSFIEGKKIVLWPKIKHSDEIAAQRSIYYNVANGISFRSMTHNVFEAVSLSSTIDNDLTDSFYIEYMENIKCYVDKIKSSFKFLDNIKSKNKYYRFDDVNPQLFAQQQKKIFPKALFNPIHIDHQQLYLTPKEFQLLEEAAKGKTSKQIAYENNLSPRTIEVHLRNIKNKTGIQNKADLLQLFREAF